MMGSNPPFQPSRGRWNIPRVGPQLVHLSTLLNPSNPSPVPAPRGTVVVNEPCWIPKNVQRRYNAQEAFNEIRDCFDKASEEELLGMTFTFVHFNSYSPGFANRTVVPSEFCCLTWSLKNAVEWIGGSLVDPGIQQMRNMGTVLSQTKVLSIPYPPYTYDPTVAYGVGEDRFEDILNAIHGQATAFSNPNVKYVFAVDANKDDVIGCLAWLMHETKMDPDLRVLTVEELVGEIFRTCQLRRWQEEKNMIKMDISQTEDDRASILRGYARKELVKDMLFWCSQMDYKIQMSCTWHQRTENYGSMEHCSCLLMKKCMFNTIERAMKILHRDAQKQLRPVHELEIRPQKWDLEDSVGVEARQRFGFCGTLSQKRIDILEKSFVFPDFLKVLKRKYPQGLTIRPESIIWPLARDIETDLNWCSSAIYIHDPEPGTRARKRKMLEDVPEKKYDPEEW